MTENILDRVPAAFRSPEGLWVGLSGRARVIVYNTDAVNPGAPRASSTTRKPEWRGRLAIVPRSDKPRVRHRHAPHARRGVHRQWLLDLKANAPRTYPNNIAAITAVKSREIEVAFLNHYYLYRFLAEEGEGFKARNYYFENGDLGGLFLVSGAGVLDSATNPEGARRFIAYLLEKSSQEYFAAELTEYPLVRGRIQCRVAHAQHTDDPANRPRRHPGPPRLPRPDARHGDHPVTTAVALRRPPRGSASPCRSSPPAW